MRRWRGRSSALLGAGKVWCIWHYLRYSIGRDARSKRVGAVVGHFGCLLKQVGGW